MPVGLHVIARPDFHGSSWYDHTTFHGSPFYFLSVTLGFDIQASFVSMFEGGTLERFPTLKLLGAGGWGWLGGRILSNGWIVNGNTAAS